MRYTPDRITKLKENEIFVFGSNLLGEHGGGSARQAFDEFGAEWGVGEGLTGQCYAFPTLDEKYGKRTQTELVHSVGKLVETANKYPDKTFLVTRVGCGIAGYRESDMISLFRSHKLPVNLVLPKGWTMDRQIIERILADIQILLDEPSSDFQDEGERWEGIVDLIEEILKAIPSERKTQISEIRDLVIDVWNKLDNVEDLVKEIKG